MEKSDVHTYIFIYWILSEILIAMKSAFDDGVRLQFNSVEH